MSHKVLTCYFASTLILVLYVLTLISKFTAGVMVNDDVAMMAFANGDFTGKPESQLVFIGPLMGEILQSLYELNQNVPWYPLTFVALQVLASALLITSAFKSTEFKMTRQFIGVLTLIALITPTITLDISFSMTAMYVASCAIFSIVLVMHSDGVVKPQTLLFPVVLICFASSIRFDFLVALAVLIAPVMLLIFQKFSRHRAAQLVVICVVLLLFHFGEQKITENNLEWQEYLEYNQVRGSMHGTPSFSAFVSSAYGDETIEKIRKFGWESEDLLLFGSWYFENKTIFGIDQLKSLRQNLDTTSVNLPLQPSLENMFAGRQFLLLSGVFVLLFSIAEQTRLTKRLTVIQVLWFIGVSLFISSRYRYPDRFAIPALFALFVALILPTLAYCPAIYNYRQLNRTRFILNSIAFLSVVSWVSLSVPHKFSAGEISKRNELEQTRLTSELNSIEELTKDGTVIFVGAQIAAEGFNPWDDLTLLKGNQFLGLGWASQSPHQELRKSNMGLDGDLIGRIINQRNKFILTSNEIANLLKYSYERREGIDLEFINVADLTYGSIFSVRSQLSEIADR